MEHFVVFENVWKTYAKDITAKTHTALQEVCFTLQKGETLGLVGANGAGKSTCIKLLMDFIRPDKGDVLIFNASPQKHESRQRIGYLPETASFPANLTILDMLRYTGVSCRMTYKEIASRGEKWLKRLNLWEAQRRPLRDFSKGMQQRANFAIALLHNPELLILDEPMSGLDPIGRADILDLILELKNEGCSILFCSHILEDVDRVADRVLLLHKGKSLFEGKPVELCQATQTSTFVDGFLKIAQGNGNHDA